MPLASNSEADMWTSWAAADRIPTTGDSVRKSVAIRGDVGPLTCYQNSGGNPRPGGKYVFVPAARS